MTTPGALSAATAAADLPGAITQAAAAAPRGAGSAGLVSFER